MILGIYLFVGLIWAIVSCVQLAINDSRSLDTSGIVTYISCFLFNFLAWPIIMPVSFLVKVLNG